MARKKTSTRKAPPEQLVLHDSCGRPRILLGVFTSHEIPMLQLCDKDGMPRITLQTENDGRNVLHFNGSQTGAVLGMNADENGKIGLFMNRPDGAPLFSLAWSADEGLKVWFSEKPTNLG